MISTTRIVGFVVAVALAPIAGAFLTGGFVPGALGGEVTATNVGGVFGVPVVSMKEMRSLTVIRQQYDYSCGAAAIATLLTYHYGRATTEETVFKAMYEVGDQETIRVKGFSMLDMKRYIDGQGYHADGFRLKAARLRQIGVPVITLVDIKGYKHFVVGKGMADDRVLVGDPAFGTSVMDLERFEAIWSGTVLAIRDAPHEARKQFNKAAEWSVRPRAPIGDGVDRSGLSSFTLHLPGRRDF